tara:strand:- start:600 stop:785 length:186 start_codon:yes stop_codon:yes gene_type:complete
MILLLWICWGACSSWMLSGVQEAKVPNEKIAAIKSTFRVFIINGFVRLILLQTYYEKRKFF